MKKMRCRCRGERRQQGGLTLDGGARTGLSEMVTRSQRHSRQELPRGAPGGTGGGGRRLRR